ncbi:MAG: hypothetical protein ABSH08_01320 [Tepidisphaeraceae bacterium]|jgi:hypothetical protein
MRHHSTIFLLFLFLAGCESEGTVTFDTEPLDIRTVQQEASARVREDGLELTCAFATQGLGGQDLDISCYDDQQRFLGVTQVRPPQDGSHMTGVKVFIPHGRIYNLANKLEFNLYATPAGDRSQYLAKGRWELTEEYHGVRVVWTLKQFEEGVDLANGEHGIRLTMQLQVAGYRNHPLSCAAVVRNADLSDLTAAQGGPIVIDSGGLTSIYDDSIWETLVFSIPYSRLAALPPATEIAITPSIKDGDALIVGNVHVSAFAGGTLQELQDAAEKDVAGYDQKIDDLQKRIDELNKERGQ